MHAGLCVHTCDVNHVWGWVICAHACLEASKHLPLPFPTLFIWDKVCYWTLSIDEFQQAPPVSHLPPPIPILELHVSPVTSIFLGGFWGWNSVSHAYVASAHTHWVISPTHGSSLCCWYDCTLIEHPSLIHLANMYWISISVFNIREIMRPSHSYYPCVVFGVRWASSALSFQSWGLLSTMLPCYDGDRLIPLDL